VDRSRVAVFRRYSERVVPLLKQRPKGWRSVLYNTAMAKAKRIGPLMMPAHVSIEPTNLCNARCPVCETGNRSMERSNGLLDYDRYVTLIDELEPTTAVLMYYFMGEPFLNPRSYDMIRYARQKGIYVETCTNGDLADPEGIVYSDVNQVSFQISGLDNASHQVYRVRSDFDKVSKNVQELVKVRNATPGSNVQIELGFIVMKHNESQVPDFLAWAKGIGVDKANVIDPCVRSVAEGKQMLPENRDYWFYDEEAFARGVLKPKHLPNNECTWIWNSTMINWNGDVVPCCRDPHGRHTFGNAFDTPFKEIWNGPDITAFRRRIVTEQAKVDICKLCSGYGVPNLTRSRPLSFEVERHTFNAVDVDLAEALNSANDRMLPIVND
jgi:radical SAM protein with 4Fe4S-binding SPASM domain